MCHYSVALCQRTSTDKYCAGVPADPRPRVATQSREFFFQPKFCGADLWIAGGYHQLDGAGRSQEEDIKSLFVSDDAAHQSAANAQSEIVVQMETKDKLFALKTSQVK